MIDKIKVFAGDHLITSEYTECGSQECHKYEFDEIELEEFAQLIIRECMAVNAEFIGHRIGEIDLDIVYKEHFGIQ